MKKEYVIGLLIPLILSNIADQIETAKQEGDEFECYNINVYHYWAFNLTLSHPIMTLASPPTKDEYQLIIDEDHLDILYNYIKNRMTEENEKRLQDPGLEKFSMENGSLYFYFSGSSTEFIQYNGKFFVAVANTQGNFGFDDLDDLDNFDSLSNEIDAVTEIVRAAILENFCNETKELRNRYASSNNCEIKTINIFNEFLINIRDTNIKNSEVNQELHDYFEGILHPRHEREIYPEKYTNFHHIELRGKTSNIFFHDDKYEFNLRERYDKFDIYILLNQINRICEESLDLLEELRSIPDSREEVLSQEFNERWDTVRDILGFMEEATFVIEKHKSLFPFKSNDLQWMIEYRYNEEVLTVEMNILIAGTRALNYDTRYETEKRAAQTEEMLILTQNLLSRTEEMVKKTKCLLYLTMTLVVITIAFSFGSLFFQTRSLRNFQAQIKSIYISMKNIERLLYRNSVLKRRKEIRRKKELRFQCHFKRTRD